MTITSTRDAIMALNENSSTRLKSALFGDASGKIKTWALLSAENALGQPLSPQENNKRTKNLKDQLGRMHIQYVPVEGVYDGMKEHSFMLFNLRLSDAETIARDFEQVSFFFAETRHPEGDNRNTSALIKYYASNDGAKTYKAVDEGSNIVTLKDANDYFSRHGDFQFSIDMDIFHESFITIYDEQAFNESFDESKTGKFVSMKRWFAYNNRGK